MAVYQETTSMAQEPQARIDWLTDWEEALGRAVAERRPIFLDLWKVG